MAAELGERSCIPQKAVNRIWSQGSASSQTGWMSKDYFQSNGFALSSAFGEPKCNGGAVASIAPAGLGPIVHEYLHGTYFRTRSTLLGEKWSIF